MEKKRGNEKETTQKFNIKQNWKKVKMGIRGKTLGGEVKWGVKTWDWSGGKNIIHRNWEQEQGGEL
jgi:hypothetical protein